MTDAYDPALTPFRRHLPQVTFRPQPATSWKKGDPLPPEKNGTDPSTFVTLTAIVDEFPAVVDEWATAPVLLHTPGQIGRELRLIALA